MNFTFELSEQQANTILVSLSNQAAPLNDVINSIRTQAESQINASKVELEQIPD